MMTSRERIHAAVEFKPTDRLPALSHGGGYVFCNTHNILAEVSPEKVTALYRTAHEF